MKAMHLKYSWAWGAVLILLAFAAIATAQTTQPGPPTLAPGKVDRLTEKPSRPVANPDEKWLSKKVDDCVWIGGDVWMKLDGAKRAILATDIPRYIRVKDGKVANSVESAFGATDGYLLLTSKIDGFDQNGVVGVEGDVVVLKDGEVYWAITGLKVSDIERWKKWMTRHDSIMAEFAGKKGGDKSIFIGGKKRDVPSLIVAYESDDITTKDLSDYISKNKLTRWPVAKLEEKTREVITSSSSSGSKHKGFLDKAAERSGSKKTETYSEWVYTWQAIPGTK